MMRKAYRPLTWQDGIEGKECTVCKKWKAKTEYGKGGYDGLDHRCNGCRKDQRDARRATPIGDIPRPTGYAILRYEGAEIAFESDRTQASLTDLWIAAEQPKNQEPWRWLEQDQPKAMLAQYARERGNLMLDKVCTARSGAHGGTWAPREIALAYAMYLNPALALAVLRFVLERSDEFVAASGGLSGDQLIPLLKKFLAPLYQRFGMLDLLPSMDRKLDGLGGKVDDIKDKIDNEPERWIGQEYIIHITNEMMVALIKRKFRSWPEDKEHLVAVGRTGANGDVYGLRLKDLLGKIDLEPEDYSILSSFGNPCPEDCENHTLQYPLPGCERMRLKNGKPSLTFLAANEQGIQAYQRLGCGKYYTLNSLERAIPKPAPPQSPQTNFLDQVWEQQFR